MIVRSRLRSARTASSARLRSVMSSTMLIASRTRPCSSKIADIVRRTQTWRPSLCTYRFSPRSTFGRPASAFARNAGPGP
jgi:hypothetical protein